MSFFDELKRRNVFKVALAYIVAAWLVLQITDVLMSVLGLPETAGKFVFMLLVIGFIPAMVFSWAYEVTPEGIKRESEVDRSESITHETAARLNRTTIALLVAVATMVVVDRFIPETGQEEEMGSEPFSQVILEQGPAPDEEKRALTPLDTSPSVAVLPFVNMSSDEENEYFSDGISEELLNLLVRIEGLRVPSRTSSFAFKGQNTDIREIARQLEVNHILEGSVRKAGNKVRVTAQLIDVLTDTHLWSDTYDRELEDIFVIQDEIAGHIVEALQLVLTPGQIEKKLTENIAAYNLYLQGRYEFRQRDAALLDAETYLRQAVELDPDFAEAWGVLGLVYAMQSNYLGLPLEEIEPLAYEAAENARRLNPDLAEPHMVLANIASKKWDLIGARKHLENAVATDPNHGVAKLWYAISFLEGGYIKEAHGVLNDAIQIDPVSAVILDWLGRSSFMMGDKEIGIDLARQSIDLGRWQSVGTYFHYYFEKNEFQVLRGPVEAVPIEGVRHVYGHIIDAVEDPRVKSESVSSVRKLVREGSAGLQSELNTYLYLEYWQPLIELVPEIASIDATVYTHFWWPNSKPLRQLPEFREFARDYGLLELWEEYGWPDLCKPVGEDDFECE